MANRAGPNDWLSAEATSDDGHVAYRLNVNIIAGPSGGSATTIADGADVAEGATAATAYSDSTGAAAGTVVGLNKGQYVLTAALSAKLPASLGIKTAAASLSIAPASDATFVAVGNVADGAANSGNPVAVAGVFSSTFTPYTTGQRTIFRTDQYGQLRTVLVAGASAGADGGSNSNTVSVAGLGGTPGTLQPLTVAPYVFNGTTNDRQRKPNVFKRVASSAASGNPDFLKASAGDVSLFWGVCGATAAFLQLYNKTSAPTVGTDTPVLTYPITALGNFTQTIPNGGAYFSTGIAFAFTTDAAGTTGSAAAAITSFALIGA